MKPHLLVAAALLVAPGVFAAPADEKPAEAAQPAQAAQAAEPTVQRQVAEDDNVRIEEVRFRGQTQSITVKPKIRGVSPYQIVPQSGARDPSQVGGASGQSIWHFFSF